jgi:hypothetical protein
VLKRLLDYLGRQAIEGQADDLKEYRVGVEAFGKAEDYDPKLDSSVRVQASKLRQKLDEYYRTEGASDPIVIELPKGHFRLEFQPRHAEVLARAPKAGRHYRSRTVILAMLLVAALSAGLGWLARSRVGSRLVMPWTPEMQALWSPFLDSPRPIMVSLGTPLFTQVVHSFFRDPALNTWDAAAQSQPVESFKRMLGADAASPTFNYTGIGEATGAFALARLFTGRGVDVSLQASSLLTWEDIERHNVIFVGPAKFNVQTKDLPFTTDFEIRHSRLENIKPRPGEQRIFAEKRSPDGQLEEGHALITRLPGLHGMGTILILASTSTEGTRAAVEFITRPEYATHFVRSMRKANGGIPQYFQAAVRVRFESQTPLAIEQVAFHVLK